MPPAVGTEESCGGGEGTSEVSPDLGKGRLSCGPPHRPCPGTVPAPAPSRPWHRPCPGQGALGPVLRSCGPAASFANANRNPTRYSKVAVRAGCCSRQWQSRPSITGGAGRGVCRRVEAVPIHWSPSLLRAVPEKLMEVVLHCLAIYFEKIVMNEPSVWKRNAFPNELSAANAELSPKQCKLFPAGIVYFRDEEISGRTGA